MSCAEAVTAKPLRSATAPAIAIKLFVRIGQSPIISRNSGYARAAKPVKRGKGT